MRRKFPTQVILDAGEVTRINRVRIAQFYGITPGQVDSMSESDVQDTLEIMWADEQK